jgi:hypothetical protein
VSFNVEEGQSVGTECLSSAVIRQLNGDGMSPIDEKESDDVVDNALGSAIDAAGERFKQANPFFGDPPPLPVAEEAGQERRYPTGLMSGWNNNGSVLAEEPPTCD